MIITPYKLLPKRIPDKHKEESPPREEQQKVKRREYLSLD